MVSSKTNPYSSSKILSLGNFSLLNYDILTSSNSEMKKVNDDLLVDPTEKLIKEGSIEYKYQNVSSLMSYLVDPNKNNYMDGKKMYKDNINFSKNELKVAVFRLRRMVNLVEIWIELFLEIFRFKYKKWSIFIIALFHVLLYFFDMNCLHFYIVIMILAITLLNHRFSISILKERIFDRLRSVRELNPYYWEPLVHSKNWLKDHRFLQIELLRKKLKPPEGIVSDLKLIKLGFNTAPFVMHNVVNLFEKAKNLLNWYESKRTKALITFLILLLLVFYYVSFKLIVLAVFWSFVIDQMDYYEKHLERNKKLARVALAQILAKFIGSS